MRHCGTDSRHPASASASVIDIPMGEGAVCVVPPNCKEAPLGVQSDESAMMRGEHDCGGPECEGKGSFALNSMVTSSWVLAAMLTPLNSYLPSSLSFRTPPFIATLISTGRLRLLDGLSNVFSFSLKH